VQLPLNVVLDHFAVFIQVIIWLLFVLVLVAAAWRAPWYHLKEAESLNILLAMVVGVMVMWTVKAGFVAGLSIHLLGTALLTLMFGWAFAVLGIVVVLAAHTIVAGSGWSSLPLLALLLGALPAAVSFAIYRFVDTRLPNNFFIYIFLTAFFGAGISVATAVLATSIAHVTSGAFSFEAVWHDYTRYALLVMFPEAFVTGMLMTLFVVYRPEWVSTFDDSRYLDGK